MDNWYLKGFSLSENKCKFGISVLEVFINSEYLYCFYLKKICDTLTV